MPRSQKQGLKPRKPASPLPLKRRGLRRAISVRDPRSMRNPDVVARLSQVWSVGIISLPTRSYRADTTGIRIEVRLFQSLTDAWY